MLDEFDYLFELVKKYKYNQVKREEVEFLIRRWGLHFWMVCDRETGIEGGVIYLSEIPSLGYSLDAYRDHEVSKTVGNKNWSYQAGKLVVQFYHEHYDEVLFTTHSVRNRAATIMCKRLGFEVVYTYNSKFGEFILMAHKGGNHGS
jgi:hypothetical protein